MIARFRPATTPGHMRVVGLAGRAEPAWVTTGVERLRAGGWRVSGGAGGGQHPYLAADDAERAERLVDAFLDPHVDAVICARGGYGSLRLLDRVDFQALADTRKPFVGFSDITALHLALNAAGLVTIHGPVVTLLGKVSPEAAEELLRQLGWLLAGQLPAALRGVPVNGGSATGPLIGGNLSMLAACLPIKRLCPLPRGAVLLIEEVNEPLYRIDRMLTGLLLAGLLDDVAGFALGSFAGCGEGGAGMVQAAEVAVGIVGRLGVPIMAGLPVGHAEGDVPVLLGAPVTLDASGWISFGDWR